MHPSPLAASARRARRAPYGWIGQSSRALIGVAFAAIGVASCNLVAGLGSIKYSTGAGGESGCSTSGCNGGGPTESAGPGTGGFGTGGFGGFGSGGSPSTGGQIATGGQASSSVQSTSSGGGAVSCACTPGATSTEPCGNCGTATRTCQLDCTWGAYGNCAGEGACKPGATDSQGCGNCGNQSRSCGNNCQWSSFGNCNGQGECAPGSHKTGCDPCGQVTCGNNCSWGTACQPQKQCLYAGGSGHQCCGPGKCQFCDEATCDWFPCQDCATACPACGC